MSMKHGSDTNRCSEQNHAETNAEDSDPKAEDLRSLRGTAIGRHPRRCRDSRQCIQRDRNQLELFPSAAIDAETTYS
jgi:hypothetical protein